MTKTLACNVTVDLPVKSPDSAENSFVQNLIKLSIIRRRLVFNDYAKHFAIRVRCDVCNRSVPLKPTKFVSFIRKHTLTRQLDILRVLVVRKYSREAKYKSFFLLVFSSFRYCHGVSLSSLSLASCN